MYTVTQTGTLAGFVDERTKKTNKNIPKTKRKSKKSSQTWNVLVALTPTELSGFRTRRTYICTPKVFEGKWNRLTTLSGVDKVVFENAGYKGELRPTATTNTTIRGSS